MIKRLFFIFILILCVSEAFNQVSLPRTEAFIQKLHQQITPASTDKDKLNLTDSLLVALETALNNPGAFDYPFDSLKFIGKISSDDRKLKILTWNLPLSDATNCYYGFILYKTSGDSYKVFRLTDSSAATTNAEYKELTNDNWYGCLVYDIIDVRNSGETWYTLLGYDPDNIFTSKKLIDILSFSNNKPVFGKPVFNLKRKTHHRVIFEYSARVQMMLIYDQRPDMIIFDHLAPSSPAYQGNFTYYGPDFSHDGFKFEKGMWELRENIDIRAR